MKKKIRFYFLLFLIFGNGICYLSKTTNDYQEQKSLSFRKSKHFGQNHKKDHTTDYIKFIAGMGVGFGLTVDATEQLKNCFIEKEQHNQIMHQFFIKTNALRRKENSVIEETEVINKDNKTKVQHTTKIFTKEVLDFFSNFKDCTPFKETFLSFIKNRIFNIGIKGIAYAVGGVLGLLIKSSYDIYKLLTEIKDFYKVRSKHPIDYLNLGSSVGKIIYYAQNLILRKRK